MDLNAQDILNAVIRQRDTLANQLAQAEAQIAALNRRIEQFVAALNLAAANAEGAAANDAVPVSDAA